MTADERIEKLLNRFGQTISDLPKLTEYSAVTRGCAMFAAFRAGAEFPQLSGYLCHLADVIDRMEAALETAANNCGCEYCDKDWRKCREIPQDQFVCDFKLSDEFLDDRDRDTLGDDE